MGSEPIALNIQITVHIRSGSIRMEKSDKDKRRVLLHPKALFIYMESYTALGKVLNRMNGQPRKRQAPHLSSIL